MPIAQTDLEAILREGFPDAEIQIDDLAGDGDHYRAKIVSAAFKGLRLCGAEGPDGRRTPRPGARDLGSGLTRRVRLPSSWTADFRQRGE